MSLTINVATVYPESVARKYCRDYHSVNVFEVSCMDQSEYDIYY